MNEQERAMFLRIFGDKYKPQGADRPNEKLGRIPDRSIVEDKKPKGNPLDPDEYER